MLKKAAKGNFILRKGALAIKPTFVLTLPPNKFTANKSAPVLVSTVIPDELTV
ncbi:MAG: hypothetical protein R2822_28960 [Spirosomataceae bacterium]